MDMTGERRIPAPREKVWAALNDPEVLRASIPGCESLEKLSDHEMKATASVKIGPIAARFTGKVNLLDLDPPNSYRIDGEGQGGVAGFAKGGAVVRLADDAEGTLLTYDVKAQVGGKIAQLGARLIDATAKQMADLFFNRFAAQVTADQAVPAVAVTAPSAAGYSAPVETTTSVSPTFTAPVAGAPSPVSLTPGGTAPLWSDASAGQPSLDAPSAAAPSVVRPLPAPPAGPVSISILSLIPREFFGFPIVAWIGGVIFLAIFVLIFGAYL